MRLNFFRRPAVEPVQVVADGAVSTDYEATLAMARSEAGEAAGMYQQAVRASRRFFRPIICSALDDKSFGNEQAVTFGGGRRRRSYSLATINRFIGQAFLEIEFD